MFLYNLKVLIGIFIILIICDNFDEEFVIFVLSNFIVEDNLFILDIFILLRFIGFDGLLFLILLVKRIIGFVNNFDVI